jgi:hypothetical protein
MQWSPQCQRVDLNVSDFPIIFPDALQDFDKLFSFSFDQKLDQLDLLSIAVQKDSEG